jgi:HlyD family secretion protein
MRFFKKILIVASVIVVLLLVIGSYVKNKAKLPKNITTVRIENPELGFLTEIVSAPGEIEPKTNVSISAKIASRIVKLPFDEGQQVTAGDDNNPASVLVRLDDKDMVSNLRSAQAQLASQAAQLDVEKAQIEGQKANLKGLEATLEQARKDAERQKQLFDSNDVSQATYDQAKCRYDELQAQYANAVQMLKAAQLSLIVMDHNLEVADARIDQAVETLSYTVITSPIDGIVTRLNAEVGELVMTGTMNNPGTVIMEVADLSRMLLVAQVDEAEIGRLEVGQKAAIHVQAFAEEEFSGVVDTIALTHDRSLNGSKYFKTEILLDKTARQLYSGLTADVDIETKVHQQVIRVPIQAVVGREVDTLPMDIREKNDQIDMNKTFVSAVYRLIDGKAVVTPVKTGPSDMTHIIIESGITIDDEIVTGPYKVLESIKHDQLIQDEKTAQVEKARNPDE